MTACFHATVSCVPNRSSPRVTAVCIRRLYARYCLTTTIGAQPSTCVAVPPWCHSYAHSCACIRVRSYTYNLYHLIAEVNQSASNLRRPVCT